MFHLDDYDYLLPEELIAQLPADPPESCKLLLYDRQLQTYQDHIFSDLPDLMGPDSILVFNDSKVIKARLPLTFSELGKSGELFFLRLLDPYTCEALVRPGKKFRVGSTLSFPEYQLTLEVREQTRDGRIVCADQPILEILEKHGQMPLPPYIAYSHDKSNSYQPFFADQPGSVAAPTASLHFTPALLQQLADKGIGSLFVTLHVGLGTFKTVDTPDITTYDIHTERIQLQEKHFIDIATAKQAGKSLVAVGTTVTRTLETMPYLRILIRDELKKKLDHSICSYRDLRTQEIALHEAKAVVPIAHLHEFGTIDFESKLFLYPPKPLYIIDQLITNFHLPKSSLLMLVAACMGFQQMKECYAHAIAHRYAFYSFGDALFIK